MSAKNVILIVTDEMRGDAMGHLGHKDVKTPYLDTLAAKGVSYKNAISACPSCIPARAALLTGMSQTRHGRVGYEDSVKWSYSETIASAFTTAGYHTHCAGKMHVHPSRSLQGFMSIDLHDGYMHCLRKSSVPYFEHQNISDDYFWFLKSELGVSADITDTGLECNSWVTRVWPYEERLHPTNWVTDCSLDFLRRRDRDKPFFLMTSYVRPHAPYDPPQAFYDMYKDKALQPPVIGDWADRTDLERNGRIFCNQTGPIDTSQIHDQMAGYYACISHIDNQIGRIYQSLVDDDLLDDTLIIFTSDHGELLSDHHLDRKSRPYDGAIKIPLILYGAQLPHAVNTLSDDLAELRDIMPTALDYCNIDIPDSIDGKSLLSTNYEREYLHCEHEKGVQSWHAIVTKTDKYVWYSQTGEEQYFEESLGGELKNSILNKSSSKRIAKLRQILIAELKNRPEGYSSGKALIKGKPTRTTLF